MTTFRQVPMRSNPFHIRFHVVNLVAHAVHSVICNALKTHNTRLEKSVCTRSKKAHEVTCNMLKSGKPIPHAVPRESPIYTTYIFPPPVGALGARRAALR